MLASTRLSYLYARSDAVAAVTCPSFQSVRQQGLLSIETRFAGGISLSVLLYLVCRHPTPSPRALRSGLISGRRIESLPYICDARFRIRHWHAPGRRILCGCRATLRRQATPCTEHRLKPSHFRRGSGLRRKRGALFSRITAALQQLLRRLRPFVAATEYLQHRRQRTCDCFCHSCASVNVVYKHSGWQVALQLRELG